MMAREEGRLCHGAGRLRQRRRARQGSARHGSRPLALPGHLGCGACVAEPPPTLLSTWCSSRISTVWPSGTSQGFHSAVGETGEGAGQGRHRLSAHASVSDRLQVHD